MSDAQFYFLSDQYYLDFPDDKLMKNKDITDGILHNRPCFFAFPDSQNPQIFWMIPVSSKCEKFKKIEQDKIKKYGNCPTIRFGVLLGRETAFLIQNMCPATEDYLIKYVDKNRCPVRMDERIVRDVTKNAHAVLAMAKRGARIIYPDIFTIYRNLERRTEAENQRL